MDSLHVCFPCVWFSFSVVSQVVGWEERLRNYFVLDGTQNSINQSINQSVTQLYTLCCMYCRYRGMVIGTRYGPGTGPIWLDNLACIGNESSLADCYQFPPVGWNVSNCYHNEDVSVLCGMSPVQYGNWRLTTLPQPYFL